MNGKLGASNTIIHQAGLTVQPLDENLKMDAVLSESLSDGKANRKRKKQIKRKEKKPTNIDEVPSVDHPKIEEGSIKNLAEGNENEKINKKLKSKNTKVKDEVHSLNQNNMGTTSAINLAEGDVIIEDPKVKNEVRSADQTRMGTRSTKILAEGNVTIRNLKIQEKVQSMGKTIIDTVPTDTEVHVTRKRKKKRKCVAKINAEVQREVDTGSIKNLAEGNVTIKNPKSREDAQSIDQTNMDIGSRENLDEVNVVIKNPKVQDDVQSMDQSEMDTGSTENAAELHVTRKQKKKSKAKINVEVQRDVDSRSIEKFSEGNVTIEKPKNGKDVSGKRKRKRKIKDEVQSDINTRPTENLAEAYLTTEKLKTTVDARSIENLAEGNVTIENLKIQDEAQSMDQTRVETGPVKNSAEGKIGKRRRKPKKKGQINYEAPTVVDTTPTEKLDVSIDYPNIEDEDRSTDQTKMEAVPTESSAKGNVSGKRKRKSKAEIKDKRVVDTRQTENLAAGNVAIEKPMIYEEVQSIGLTKMDSVSTENLVEGNQAHNRDQDEMDRGPTENSAEGNVSNIRKRKRKQNRKKKAKTKAEASRKMDTGSTENLPKENASIKLGGDCISNCDSLASPMEFEEKLCPNESPHLLVEHKEMSENGLSELCNEIILEKGKGYAEGTSATAISTFNVGVTMDFSSFNVKDAKDICPSPITPVRRKLLVLDVNGLLADIIYSAPNHCKGDTKIFGRAVFKRPFCDDFLKFCFQNFDVGIWSSRSKKIIVPVVNYLLGNQKDKLLFCWDMDHATKTKFNTLENKHKPLVCKDLSKIWENDACNLPWKKGDYDESNTLLLDDSPYKALLNPLHTAIFPSPYQYDNENDDSLGPGGNLRVYLEGLVTAENVQKYVEQHPFGQRPITEEHCSWDFYSKVLHQVSKAVEGKTSTPNPVEGITSTPNPVEGQTSMPNPVEGQTSMPSPVEGITSTPNPVEGKTSTASPLEGKTSTPSPLECKTSTPSPLECKTSTPNPVEGKTSTPNPVEGKTSTLNPVEGITSSPKSLKGRDVKCVEARLASPSKPKKKKTRATFMWPI